MDFDSKYNKVYGNSWELKRKETLRAEKKSKRKKLNCFQISVFDEITSTKKK